MRLFFRIFLLIILISTSFAIAAQTPKSGAPFVITLINTTRFQDVDTILRGLRRSKEVQRVWESRAVQGVIEVSGVLKGDVATFKADLLSIAAERFVLESERYEDGALHMTLRKLGDVAP